MRGWALALLALAPACGESVGPSRIPIGIQLPRVGTLGDLPGPEKRIDVSIDAAGALRARGERVDIESLPRVLAAAATSYSEDAGGSTADLVLSVDAHVPWRAVGWVLTRAAQAARLRRTFFAVLPEQGDDHGALATFLPPDSSRGIKFLAAEIPTRLDIGLAHPAETSVATDMQEVFEMLRQRETPDEIGIRASSLVPTEFVLKVVDVALRAGISHVRFDGLLVPYRPGDWDALFGESSRSAPHVIVSSDAGPRVRGLGIISDGTLQFVGPMPPGQRAHGAFVGSFDQAPEQPAHDRSTVGPLAGRRRQASDAVELALAWLAAHQSVDGSWSAASFGAWCDGKPAPAGTPSLGAGREGRDLEVTGLSLLAFLGAAYTNRGDHPFAKVVGKGLRWLRSAQDAEGCFGPRTGSRFLHDHAIATLAMVEAFGMTGSPLWKSFSQRALDFIARTRQPGGVWRAAADATQEDASTTAWMCLAILTAALLRQDEVERGMQPALAPDEKALGETLQWIETSPDRETPTLAALEVLLRGAFGAKPTSEPFLAAVARLTARQPTWGEGAAALDLEAWRFGTRAIQAVGHWSQPWQTWSRALREQITTRQRDTGSVCGLKGSWDPGEPSDGGRVEATASLAWLLNASYDYELHPVLKR